MHHRMNRLCIKLAIVDGNVRVNGFRHFHTDETTVAGQIGQQIAVIARSDERGIPTHFENVRTVWLADAGRRFLQQMLQESLLVDTDLVEFI